VVISTVFGLIFSPEKGVLNFGIVELGKLLPFLHLHAVDWLGSEHLSKTSIAILVVWRWTGYNMVLMLAGLQGIPGEYYEAAAIDGANAFRRMINITVPMMQSTFNFCLLLSILGTLYMFDEVFVLTRGGPGTSSETFGLYLFNTSFSNFKFGYASCVAYSVAAVVVIGTIVVNKLNRRSLGDI
jgi:lactose/L-arabinose transport system permease protein